MNRNLVTAVLAIVLIAPSAAMADLITGFGGNGAGWTSNGNAIIAADVLQITLNTGSTNSVWYNTPQSHPTWIATFTYQDLNELNGGADGAVFALSAVGNGLNALGGGGGSKGYDGIGNSAGLSFEIFNTSDTKLAFNGAQGGGTNTTPVNLKSGAPVDVVLTYNGASLGVSLTQGANNFNTSYALNTLAAGGPGANYYFGFTGATGGALADQFISNFTFIPEPSSIALAGLGLVGLFTCRRLRRN